MLKLAGRDFTCGCARFVDHSPDNPEPTAKIFIKVRFEESPILSLAQLDTAAAWSVLDPETADALDLLNRPGEPAVLHTRLGLRHGKLIPVKCSFLADEGRGDALETEATFFVTEDWPPGKCFLGYSGLLERIRFAVDARENLFYFGPAGESAP